MVSQQQFHLLLTCVEGLKRQLPQRPQEMVHGGVFIVAGATTKKNELLNIKFLILFINRSDLFDLTFPWRECGLFWCLILRMTPQKAHCPADGECIVDEPIKSTHCLLKAQRWEASKTHCKNKTDESVGNLKNVNYFLALCTCLYVSMCTWGQVPVEARGRCQIQLKRLGVAQQVLGTECGSSLRAALYTLHYWAISTSPTN